MHFKSDKTAFIMLILFNILCNWIDIQNTKHSHLPSVCILSPRDFGGPRPCLIWGGILSRKDYSVVVQCVLSHPSYIQGLSHMPNIMLILYNIYCVTGLIYKTQKQDYTFFRLLFAYFSPRVFCGPRPCLIWGNMSKERLFSIMYSCSSFGELHIFKALQKTPIKIHCLVINSCFQKIFNIFIYSHIFCTYFQKN